VEVASGVIVLLAQFLKQAIEVEKDSGDGSRG
jgi:hypothetical protein